MPNDNFNYALSPAAKHACRDGSLDPKQTEFNRVNNRKLKMKDSFLTLFPTYHHDQVSTGTMHDAHTLTKFHYPKTSIEGTPMATIDREYTHKRDTIKDYSESMYKVASMRRVYKAWKDY